MKYLLLTATIIETIYNRVNVSLCQLVRSKFVAHNVIGVDIAFIIDF